MRSLLVALALMAGSSAIIACTAPSVGGLSDNSADTKLPSRDTDDDDDDDNSTSDNSGGQTPSQTASSSSGSSAAQQTLTITSTGDGTGTFTSSPAGVNCTGASCTGSFASGTSITLTPTPQPGSVFAGWTGGGCTGNTTCVTTLSAASTVTAQWITLAGSWSGTYTHNESANGCSFNNAGNLSQTLTTTDNTTYTTAAQANGFQIKENDGGGSCTLDTTVSGSASASTAVVATTAGVTTITGTWDMGLGQFGDLPLPFTATLTGTKLTGKWTCDGCTGGFDISKDPATTTTSH